MEISQIDKAFWNEITSGNRPGDDEEWHRRWIGEGMWWYAGLGVNAQSLRVREHEPEELSHYSKAASDIEYHCPWGWGETQGIANRTDYGLKA